jgi:hypothetical protein
MLGAGSERLLDEVRAAMAGQARLRPAWARGL